MFKPFAVQEPDARAADPADDGTVGMQDFSFSLPTIKKGPNTLKLQNDGPQPHEFNVVKLAEGITVADVLAAFASDTPPSGPPPFASAGGFQAIDMGRTGWAKLDLVPGNYLVICGVPDPETGKSHAELGMIAGFSID